MDLEQTILDIRTKLQNGAFQNEAEISLGVVLRILSVLGWNTYDPHWVKAEYTIQSKRVDFALCSRPNRPFVFIEVKFLGKAESGEEQLFDYAYKEGVPIALLTDGKEWNFYLPAAQRNYEQRLFQKLSLIDRDVHELTVRLNRYLSYDNVCSGNAKTFAEEDLRNTSNETEAKQTIPNAWKQLVEDKDELLLELLSDKVESICGLKAKQEHIVEFVSSLGFKEIDKPVPAPIGPGPDDPPPKGNNILKVRGKVYNYYKGIDILRKFYEVAFDLDSNFGEKFIADQANRKVKLIARDKFLLNSSSSELSEKYSMQINGYWFYTLSSNPTKVEWIKRACIVLSLRYGQDVEVYFKQSEK